MSKETRTSQPQQSREPQDSQGLKDPKSPQGSLDAQADKGVEAAAGAEASSNASEAENVTTHVQTRDRQIVRAGAVGIAANALLALFKALIGLGTNSIAITLDAVNNLSDAASSLVTIVGTKLAGKKPDRKHPFGHGRVEYLTTIVVAVIVLWAGITSAQESIERIITPATPSYDVVSLVIVAVAVAAKVALGLYTRRVGIKVDSGSLKASATDALMDAIISAATLVAALVYIASGISLEAWLGAVISVVIIKAGVDMLREVTSRIIGERVSPDLTRAVKRTVASVEGVNGAYDLILEDHGPERLWGSVHVEVPEDMTARVIDGLTRRIQAKVYQEEGVLLHTVGIYSYNTGGGELAQIMRDVVDVSQANEHVLEVHGLYVDEERKAVRFDLVVSFDAPDRQAVVDRIRGILERRYPDYRFAVTLDSDISD